MPKFNHLQVDAVLLGGLRWYVARVALVGIGPRNASPRGHLHFFRQHRYLGPVLFVSQRDEGRRQVAQRVDSHVHLAALTPFGAVVAPPLSGMLSSVRKSKITALGSAGRASCKNST